MTMPRRNGLEDDIYNLQLNGSLSKNQILYSYLNS